VAPLSRARLWALAGNTIASDVVRVIVLLAMRHVVYAGKGPASMSSPVLSSSRPGLARLASSYHLTGSGIAGPRLGRPPRLRRPVVAVDLRLVDLAGIFVVT
jgi:hypothetical protein